MYLQYPQVRRKTERDLSDDFRGSVLHEFLRRRDTDFSNFFEPRHNLVSHIGVDVPGDSAVRDISLLLFRQRIDTEGLPYKYMKIVKLMGL